MHSTRLFIYCLLTIICVMKMNVVYMTQCLCTLASFCYFCPGCCVLIFIYCTCINSCLCHLMRGRSLVYLIYKGYLADYLQLPFQFRVFWKIFLKSVNCSEYLCNFVDFDYLCMQLFLHWWNYFCGYMCLFLLWYTNLCFFVEVITVINSITSYVSIMSCGVCTLLTYGRMVTKISYMVLQLEFVMWNVFSAG